MIAPIGINIAVAAVHRRRRQDAESASQVGWPDLRTDAEYAEEIKRNMEAHDRAERDFFRIFVAILLIGFGLALFMLWAWLRDTGRI